MNPKTVLQKTDKGREEIAKRTYRLEARKRTLLILVDGQSDAETLAGKAAHLASPLEMLESLLAEGFVKAVGAEEGPVPGPAAPEAARAMPGPAAGGAGAPLPLEELKRLACTLIEKVMGPDGMVLALKIEQATTREEFFAEARKIHKALSSFVGARQAEAFAKALNL